MCTNDMHGMKIIQTVQFVNKRKVQKSRLGTSPKSRMPILGPLWYCFHHGALQLFFIEVTPSPIVSVCDPTKKISHPSLVLYFLMTPLIKQNKDCKQVGDYQQQTTRTNHYDWRIINKEHQLDHICYTFLWQVHTFTMPFTNLKKLCKNALPKPFC